MTVLSEVSLLKVLIFFRSLLYGVYKVKFFSRMWDDDDQDPNWTHKLPFEGEAYTYIEILPTPLLPVLVKGALTYMTRGEGQFLNMEPSVLSFDPDFPDDGVGCIDSNYFEFILRYNSTVLYRSRT